LCHHLGLTHFRIYGGSERRSKFKFQPLHIMKRRRKIISILVVAAIGLLLWLLFGPRSVKLRANGKVVAVFKSPSALSWSDEEYPVYAGETKLFSVWGDFFHCPLYVYAFADGKRFLFGDDDDTSILVFVVDLRSGSTNLPRSSDWPSDDYLRNYMENRAPNVMIEGSNYVRLPNIAEVREAASNIDNIPKLNLFPVFSKTSILDDLATNRTSVWP
jgi:hypothetical protein